MQQPVQPALKDIIPGLSAAAAAAAVLGGAAAAAVAAPVAAQGILIVGGSRSQLGKRLHLVEGPARALALQLASRGGLLWQGGA